MDNHTDVRGLTILQPWASAIAIGAKQIETRSRSTSYRGTLLIHAGLNDHGIRYRKMTRHGSPAYKAWDAGFSAMQAADLATDYRSILQMRSALGCIIAVAELVDCIPTDYEYVPRVGFREILQYPSGAGRTQLTDQEIALGNYEDGRYGWILDNVRKLPQPIPFKGKQGLWKVPPHTWAEVHRQLAEVG